MRFDPQPVLKFAPIFTSWSSSGVINFRNLVSASSSILQITAVALATLLNRFAASVRSRSVVNGDPITAYHILLSQAVPLPLGRFRLATLFHPRYRTWRQRRLLPEQPPRCQLEVAQRRPCRYNNYFSRVRPGEHGSRLLSNRSSSLCTRGRRIVTVPSRVVSRRVRVPPSFTPFGGTSVSGIRQQLLVPGQVPRHYRERLPGRGAARRTIRIWAHHQLRPRWHGLGGGGVGAAEHRGHHRLLLRLCPGGPTGPCRCCAAADGITWRTRSTESGVP